MFNRNDDFLHSRTYFIYVPYFTKLYYFLAPNTFISYIWEVFLQGYNQDNAPSYNCIFKLFYFCKSGSFSQCSNYVYIIFNFSFNFKVTRIISHLYITRYCLTKIAESEKWITTCRFADVSVILSWQCIFQVTRKCFVYMSGILLLLTLSVKPVMWCTVYDLVIVLHQQVMQI